MLIILTLQIYSNNKDSLVLPEVKLEEFAYETSFDLNKVYYTIKLDPDAQKVCTILTPFGKYQYLILSCSRDNLQEKKSD
jgi:hypothetical protein